MATAAVKVAVWPAATVWSDGWVVSCGTNLTVSVAAVVGVAPIALVKTARYSYWFWVEAAVRLSVLPVAPARFVKVVPPLVLTCHCTVGLGSPVAAAVNVADWPAMTVRLAGGVVIAGAY